MAITLIIKDVRLSFAQNLVTPSDPQKGKQFGKHSTNLIAGKDPTIIRINRDRTKLKIARKDLTSVIEEVLKEKFNGKVPGKYENWVVRDNSQAVSTKTGDRHDGYEDDEGFYLSPSRIADPKMGPPAFVRRDNSILDIEKPNDLAEALRLFQSGNYVTAKINIGAYEFSEDGVTKRGVTSYLEGVQYLREGEKFGAGASSADGFEAEEDEDFDEP